MPETDPLSRSGRVLSALQDHARRGLCSAIVFYKGPTDTPVVRTIEPLAAVVRPAAFMIHALQREPIAGMRAFWTARILEVRPSPLTRSNPEENHTPGIPYPALTVSPSTTCVIANNP